MDAQETCPQVSGVKLGEQDPQLAARTGAKGRTRVEQLMTLDRTVAELSDLYSRLAGKPTIR